MRPLLVWTLLCLGLAAAARADQIEGVRFAPKLELPAVRLDLHRTALLRYAVVLKVYVAGLYLGEGVEVGRLLDDVPRRLEIEYFYGFTADQFATSTRHGITANLGEERAATLSAEIDALNALYRDVEPGDRYTLTYVPGAGTELALNGEALGRIPGSDFSSALFSIWFGSAPISPALKRDLLAPR